MCAFQDGRNGDGKKSAASTALANNRHAHPALQQLSDERLGTAAGSETRSRSASPAVTKGDLATRAIASPGDARTSVQTKPGESSATDNDFGKQRGVADSEDSVYHHHRRHNARRTPSHWNKYVNRNTNDRSHDRADGTMTPTRYHDLSHTNKSVQDVGLLERLVDDRSGQHEDKRASEEFLNSVAKRKNGSAIRAYYERLNEVLDGWREVDEIVDSQFPDEVMLRFGTVEEVERFNGSRRKLPWTKKRSGAHKARRTHDTARSSSDNDSGYQEESESDHVEEELDPKQRRRQSQLARVASAAFSGLWFGTPTKMTQPPLRDEETGLLHSGSSPATSGAASYSFPSRDYGAASLRQDSPAGGRLSVIHDEDTQGSGSGPATDGASGSRRKEEGKEEGNSHAEGSDDDIGDDAELGIAASKLDRRIAEERKGRDRTRAAAIAATGSIARNKASAERSTSVDKAQSKAQPGGLSERDRKRLLRHVPGREEREGERERGANFAININLAVNVLLLAGKVIAVFSSNSVSLIASLVDSALDLLSTIIIFGTSKAISYRSFHTYFKYPVGKKRFEPLGVVIFAVLMIASFCQVLVESVERLYAVLRSGKEAPGEGGQLPFVGIAFMVLTIIIKLAMWLIYRHSPSSGVRAVAQDAENDVVFNTASLIFPVIGSRFGWPALDPIGGVCLSIYIIYEWLDTLTETVSKLTGAVGSAQDISRALYLILRFQSVNAVSAFELYHAGDDMIVEADVVLPHSLALKEAHDLGEIITYCTEGIVQIERAYIHLDYNPVGQAGHITGRG